MAVEFGVLGELRVTADGVELPLGGARQRQLLARLLLSRDAPVTRDTLVADLHPDAVSSRKALQVAVSRLRESLARSAETAGRLTTTASGYRLRIAPGELDADRFEALLAAGHASLEQGAAPEAAAHLREALAVWRGPALADLAPATWAAAEAARLEERRMHAVELRCEAELALGIGDGGVAELSRLVALHPGRERLRATLMRALYGSGRQADALAVYRQAWRHLVEQHGIEPGRELRELHQAMLVQDPRLGGRDALAAAEGPLPARLAIHRRRIHVGRHEETVALEAVLERCRAGERRAVFVGGEPGIGKTSLAVEVARRAQERGFTVLAGRCDEELEAPFQPFAEALEGRTEAFAGPRDPERPDADVTIAGSRQYALFVAVGDLLHRLGEDAPVLLVLEDLQWADHPTQLLLRHLLTTPVAARLTLLATYRDNEVPERHRLKDLLADLHREAGVVRLELGGLADAEVAELVDAIDPGAPAGADAVATLRRSTGGNPFFLTEVLGAFPAAGRAPGDEPFPLPGSVRETIRRRVRRLGEDVVACLCAAAVLGVEFDPWLLDRVVPAAARSADALEEARASGLVDDVGQVMAFRHALIAQTLHDELPGAERRRLHRSAAEALAADPARQGAAGPSAVARHWIQAGGAGDADQAILWCRRAAEQALAQSAPQKAQQWYEQALALHDAQPAPSPAERCELLVGLGIAQRHSGAPAFRETLLEAARSALALGDDATLVRAAQGNTRGFVSAVGEADEERIAVLERALDAVGPTPSPERACLLANLAGELCFTGDWSRRLALSDEALRIARGQGDLPALVHVLGTRYLTISRPETLAERFANTAECRDAAALLGDPLAQFEALHWRASAAVQNGAFEEARVCRRRASLLADRVRQPTALWMAAFDEADELIVAGRLAEAEERALAAAQLGEASGQPDASLLLASQLIILRHDQGRLGELTDLIAVTLEANPRLTGYRSVLALAYCEERRFDEAAAVLALDAPDDFAGLAQDLTWLSVVCTYAHVAARLLPAGAVDGSVVATLRTLLAPWADQIAYIGPAGGRMVAHHLGMVELALGEHAAAREHLGGAMRRAERLPAPVWAARSRVEYGRCLLAGGEGDAAEPLLRQAAREATALGALGVARDAETLLLS